MGLRAGHVSRWLLVAVAILLLPARTRLLAQGPDRRPRAPARTPELITQLGHLTSVTSVSLSPDERLVLTTGDVTARLWDAGTGRELRRFEGHGSEVLAAAFSPDGRRVATVADEEEEPVRLFDAATGRLEKQINHPDASVKSVTFSLDGRFLLMGGSYAVKLELATGRVLRFQGPDAVFSPDGRYVSIADGVAVRLVDTVTGGERRFALAENGVFRFSPDARSFVAGGSTGDARIYEVSSGRELQTLADSRIINNSNAVAFSRDGRFIAVNAPLSVWDVVTGEKVRQFDIDPEALSIRAVAIASGGGLIFIGCGDRSARILSVKTGSELHRLEGLADYVTQAKFSPDGRFIVTKAVDANFVFGSEYFISVGEFLWDTATGQQTRRFNQLPAGSRARMDASPDFVNLSTLPQSCKGVSDVSDPLLLSVFAYSPDGYSIATTECEIARLFNAVTGREVRSFVGHSGILTAIAFSPDGRRLVTAGTDKTTRLWEVATGAQLWTTNNAGGQAVFSPDGRFVLTGDRVKFRVNVETGARITGQIQSDQLLEYSPDGQRLLTSGDDETQKAFDARTGKPLVSFKPRTGPSDESEETFFATFSPDATLVAALRGHFTAELNIQAEGHHLPACIWNAGTNERLRCLKDRVSSIAFSPNGRFLVTASYDRTTRLWDAATGQERCRLISFRDGTWVVVDPLGRFDTNNLESIKGLHWVFPDRPFRPLGLEVFMREYYEPRLLTRILSGEELPLVASVADIDRRQPVVEIMKAELEKNTPDRVTVTVRASAGEIHDLRLFRDGQLVGYRQGRLPVNPETGKAVLSFAGIALPGRSESAEVVFSAYAFSAFRIKSSTAYLTLPLPERPATTRRRRAYLVTVAVAWNQSPLFRLMYPDSDARRFQQVLGDTLRSRDYDIVGIPLISGFDEQKRESANLPTKSNVKTVLDLLAGHAVEPKRRAAVPAAANFAPATPDDLVLVVFSGHGYVDRCGELFLFPVDLAPRPGESAAATTASRCLSQVDRDTGFNESLLRRAISNRELSAWLRDVDAGDLVMIVDACHAAAAVEGQGFKPGPMGSRGLGQLAYDKGMQILATTQAADVARAGGDFEGSVLMEALIERGLKEGLADFRPKDSRITLREWLQYGVEEVPTLFEAKRVREQLQRPALFDFIKHDRDLPLAAVR